MGENSLQVLLLSHCGFFFETPLSGYVTKRRIARLTMVEGFADDLRQRFKACLWHGRINYYAAYVVLVLAVLSSGLATLSIFAGYWPKEVNAALAALPGVMYLVSRHFRFEERAKWWFEKFYGIEGLYRGLVREKRDEADVSKDRTLKSKELAARCPGFGEAPGAT